MTAGKQGGPGKPPAPAAPLLMTQQGFQRGLQYFISDRDWPWLWESVRKHHKDNPKILPSGVELTAARDRIKANDILADEDFEVPSGILAAGDPEPVPIMRSARQMIDEADSVLQVGDLLKDCLLGG